MTNFSGCWSRMGGGGLRHVCDRTRRLGKPPPGPSPTEGFRPQWVCPNPIPVRVNKKVWQLVKKLLQKYPASVTPPLRSAARQCLEATRGLGLNLEWAVRGNSVLALVFAMWPDIRPLYKYHLLDTVSGCLLRYTGTVGYRIFKKAEYPGHS